MANAQLKRLEHLIQEIEGEHGDRKIVHTLREMCDVVRSIETRLKALEAPQ
jgi:hypothetical protein